MKFVQFLQEGICVNLLSHGLLMFETPQKSDLDRNLSAILHSSRRSAQEQVTALTHEFSSKGRLKSGAFLAAAANTVRGIHEEALAQAVQFLRDFLERTRGNPTKIIEWAKPHLVNVGSTLLGQIPPMGMSNEHQQILHQYRADFEQRLDGALRDFEIGFIGGRSVVGDGAPTTSTSENSMATTRQRAEAFVGEVYKRVGANRNRSVVMWQVGEVLGYSREDSSAITDYAVDRGWIAHQSMGGNIVITTNGIDLVEEKSADAVTPGSAPEAPQAVQITGSITNSIIQVAGSRSSQEAVASAEAVAAVRESLQLLGNVIKTVNEHTEEIEQLRADIETAEAQLAAPKPRKAVLFEALKSITENALGSVLGGVLTNLAPNLGALLERALLLLR